MKKYAFLSCDDLSEFVVDDNYIYELFVDFFQNDKMDILSWSDTSVKWADYDYVVVRTTWDYTKRLDEFLEKITEIEDQGCKILNPPAIIKWNAKKNYLKDLSNDGVNIIESVFLEDETLESFKEKLMNWPLKKIVLKPVVGASSDDIEILSKEEISERFSKIEDKSKWFVQPFLEEVLEGERSYIFFNGELSHTIKKVPKEGDFRVQEEHGGEISLYKPSEDEIKEAKTVIDNLGEKLLYARVDMIKTENGQKLIELELIEPSLYFRIDPPSAKRFLKALKSV